MKIFDSGSLKKAISETIKNEAQEREGGLIGMLFDTSGASLLGNWLTGKVPMKPGEGTTRAGKSF